MTRICPRCGHQNDDAMRFCTSCGNAIEPATGQPASPPVPPAAAPAGRSGSSTFIIAAAVILVIIAAAAFLQLSGRISLLPSKTPEITQAPTAVPAETGVVIIDTPVPDMTVFLPDSPAGTTPVPDTTTLPPTTKKPLVCPSDRSACSGECRDLMTDRGNCGACGIACPGSQICQMGQCMIRCAPSEASCFDGCHNLSFDSNNCGACGNSCPVGLECNRSVCSPLLKTVIPTYAG